MALPAAESRVPGGVAPRDSAPPGRDVRKNLYKLAPFVIRIYIVQPKKIHEIFTILSLTKRA